MTNKTTNENHEQERANQTAESGRLRKDEMRNMKKKVKAFEKENKQWIILYRTADNWWAMGGVSMLLYKVWYAPRLNKSPNVHRDSDYYNRFEEGIISINDIDGFVEKMVGLGLKCAEKGKYRVLLKLPKRLLPEELKALKNDEKIRRAQLNAILAPKMGDPELEDAIMQIATTANKDTKSSPMNRKKQEISSLAESIWENFNRMTMGRMRKIRGCAKVLQAVDDLMVKVRILYELDGIIDKDALLIGGMGRVVEVKARHMLAGALRERRTESTRLVNALPLLGLSHSLGDMVSCENLL